MKEFNSIKQLVENSYKMSNDAYIYILDAAVEQGSPVKGGYAVLEAEEEAELNDNETGTTFGRDMRYLMEVETLKKLIKKHKENNPGASTDDLVKTVEHYVSSDEVIDDMSE